MISKLSKKLDLCYYSTLQRPIECDNDPISKLIFDFSDILSILESEKEETMKFLYFNKSIVNKILGESEEEIKLKSKKNYQLSELFYLNLLMMENTELVNFIYPIDYIYEINFYKRNISAKEMIKKIIISKIVIELINNYTESDEYRLHDANELELLADENSKDNPDFINENKILFSSFNIRINPNNNINEFYIKIISDLIKSNSFENPDIINMYRLVQDLELESIYLTKKMLDELYKLLDIKDNNIKTYMILKKEDFLDCKKINFYYFLLKYIFKNSFYIYQVPLLSRTRKTIIKLMNNNFNQLSVFNVNEFKENIEYVIRTLTDSEYYYKKYLEFDEKPLMEVLSYYKKYFFESRKEDINIIEKIIKSKNNTAVKNYLEDLDNAKKMIIKFPIINYLYSLRRKYDNIPKSENEFKNAIDGWGILETMIKRKKFKKMIKTCKIALINFFNDSNNKDSLLKIFNQETYDYFIKENLKYLDEKKYKKDLNDIKELNDPKNNIKKGMETTEGDNIKLKSEKQLIEENQNSNLNNINTKDDTYVQKVIKTNFNYMILKDFESNDNNLLYINKKVSQINIIEFIKIIEDFSSPAEFIKELSNGFFVTANGSGGIKNNLYIYNKNCEKLIEISEIEDTAFDVYEIIEQDNKDTIQIIACLNKFIYNIYIHIKEKKLYIELYTGNYCKIFLKMEGDKCIIAGEKGAIYTNLIYKNVEKDNSSKTITNLSIIGGIRINSNIAALKSNSVVKNGEDKIIFYNCETNNIIKEIEGYSFTSSSCGLCLMPREEIENNHKILLCACKKYSSSQKNGILLINTSNFEEKEYFYPADDYEVTCFCPILIVNNNNPKDGDIINKENIKITDTDFFLVGGFDEKKRNGIIKLFKLIKDDEKKDIKIEYIQDIVFDEKDNFNGIEMSISCIIQSKITGNIIATSWDGKVYLFHPPNIDHFLFPDLPNISNP